ncbi:MAG: ATP-binding protein [Victivallales bacterium]|nr:ATP-binding protein [Victivallales bacterium]
MELLYFFGGVAQSIPNDIGINFGGKYLFDYDPCTNELEIKQNDMYISNFWGNNINNVTAVVGENGCYKTTLMDGITQIFSNDGISWCPESTGKLPPYLFVSFHNNTIHVFCCFELILLDNFAIKNNTSNVKIELHKYLNDSESDDTKTHGAISFASIMEKTHTIFYSNSITSGTTSLFDDKKDRLSDISSIKILENELSDWDKTTQINSFDIASAINYDLMTLKFLVDKQCSKFLNEMKFRRVETIGLFLNDSLFTKARKSKGKHSSEFNSLKEKIKFCCEYLSEDSDGLIREFQKLHDHKTAYKQERDNILFKASPGELEDFHEMLKKLVNIYEKYPYFGEIFDFGIGTFSSGERALLNLFSRFYDLREKDEIKKANSLLIVLDEPEIYMHPQWQKHLPYRLLKMCESFFPDKQVQIIFSTNNPIMLSDLPTHNIVYLEKERKEGKDVISVKRIYDQRTFAASVTKILADSFFLQGGIIGEFAKEKINDIIRLLDFESDDKAKINMFKKNQDRVKRTISLIGEPVIRGHLEQKFHEAVTYADFQQEIEHCDRHHSIDRKIKKLENELESLRKQQRKNSNTGDEK